MSRIAVLGAASEEIILVDRDDFEALPLDGQSIFGKLTIGSNVDIDKAIFTVGGDGASSAVTLARYGHEVVYLGNIANDAAGEAVISCFDQENIDNSYTGYIDGSTACTVTLLDAKTTERTRLEFKGVSKKTDVLDPADLEAIAPDWLYAGSLNGDMDKLLEFFEAAHVLGAKVLFAPGPAEFRKRKKLLGLLSDVDVLSLNKSEAASLVPGVVLAELLDHLSNYCQTVLITDGIMGAIASNHTESYRIGVYEQTHLRDTTGVGTAFAAGFLAAYADDSDDTANGDFAQALHFAAANAAKVAQDYGPIAGILTSDHKLHPVPITKINNSHQTEK